jgi:hypothetical protein
MSISWLFFVKKCKNLAFSKFRDKKLLWNHLFIPSKAVLILNLNFSESLSEMTMLVSSAYNIGLDTSEITLWRSLIYERKNNGPSIEPWGIP